MNEEWEPFGIRKWKKFWESFFPEVEVRFPRGLTRTPLVDVIEEKKTIKVTAELPGIDKKDIAINVLPDYVELSAEHKVEEKEKKKGYYFHERAFEKFFRRIRLPAEVIPQKTKTEYKNGILELTLTKKVPERAEKGFKISLK